MAQMYLTWLLTPGLTPARAVTTHHRRLRTRLAHAEWKIANNYRAKACKQLYSRPGNCGSLLEKKKSEFLRAAVSISDITHLWDAFWTFCWSEPTADSYITEGQLHLPYLEVINSVKIFLGCGTYLKRIKKLKKNPNPTPNPSRFLSLEISMSIYGFICFL